MDVNQLRKEYENEGLHENHLDSCPLNEFRSWFQLGIDQCPGRWFEANAISLATADTAGKPTVRVVLLKAVVDQGFRFFTNYDSRKGLQLAENPHASFVIHWPYQGRQIRVEGLVEKTSREVSEEYFHSRPRGSQIGAAISNQSSTIHSRNELETLKAEYEQQLGENSVPLPDNWGGYLLRPTRIEFWQGRLNRLHDRIVYQRVSQDAPWSVSRLAP